MRLATPAQMREIERRAESEFKIGSEMLMEAAGALSAREIQLSYLPELDRGKVGVVCGPGNNGGDGLVVARHLLGVKVDLEIILVGEGGPRSELFKKQLSRVSKLGAKIIELGKDPVSFSDYSLIVDGVFGTGLSKPVDGIALKAVKQINSAEKITVSLDVPTGMSALTGEIMGEAVRADMTLTYGLSKPGLYTGYGGVYSGRVRVLQIGFPISLFKEIANTHFLFDQFQACEHLPRRKERTNKAGYGRLLVVAGSPGTWGAASLTCEGAYRIGVGYVTLAVPEKEASKALAKEIGSEVLTTSLKNLSLEKQNAAAIGPGAGVGESIGKVIENLRVEKFKNVVLDADALTVLSKMDDSKLPPTWILTPHSGELGRLLNKDAAEIERDRMYYAEIAAKKFGCIVLLKGFRTIVATQGQTALIASGNSALAKAGTGDVLSGFIGGLLAQGVPPLAAACTGAYVHGRIADNWVRVGKSDRSLMPRDLLDLAPDILGQMSRE